MNKNKNKNEKKRVTSLILAAALLMLPAMNALADENLDEVNPSAENMQEENAQEAARGIIGMDNADKTITSYDNEETIWEKIYIDSVEDLKDFSVKCRLDTWSQNKKVYLTNDLDLSESGFVSIPTFGGFFDGQGHTVSGLVIRDSVSYTGLFCYTQETAVIMNLNVKGAVRPSGTRVVVGGVIGDNRGIVIGCTFDGIIEGNDYVGGIAGFNEQSGILIDCVSKGKVTGVHYTGGIAGENMGNIAGCTNEADINTSNEDKAKSLEDINIDRYVSGLFISGESDAETDNEASAISNTIDSGGVAGLSTGVIQFCINSGTVGYEHVGYNTGGVAGRQSGYVYACENTGTVYGRKDVGGIAGQTEPFIAIDLSEDIAYKLIENIDKMHDLIGRMLDDAGSESDEVSARLAIAQEFADRMLDDIDFLADRTVEWTDDMIGSANDAINRLDYIIEETAKKDGMIDKTRDAAGNVGDAAGKLEDVVDTLDIYQYMTPEEKESYDRAKEDMKSAAKKHSEDYANAMDAYENYYIDYVRSTDTEGKYDNPDGVNEIDLRPYSESDVDSDWTWDSGYTYEDYIGVEGWVHYDPDTGEDSDFPQSEGEQGALDYDLLSDVAKQMSDNASDIEDDASGYADKKYREENPGAVSYAVDMQKRLDTMSDIVMAHQDEMTDDAVRQLDEAVGYAKDAADNLQSAGSEVKNIADTLNGMPDIALPQLGDDYRYRTNSMTSNLQGLSENLGYLNDEISSGNDMLIDDFSDINDQLSLIMRLYTDAIDGVLDMDYTASYEDTSWEDAETSTNATIAGCRNSGTVRGDINVSGIAGTMAIEYDFDLEGDVTGIEDARMNSTFLTKCVLRGNVNSGNITAQKSCAGGISGLQEMGMILHCENYGRIASASGSYAGGVAGQSFSCITESYAKCTVSGKEYAAGITGSGSEIKNCCAIVRIKDATSFYGAIAGDADGVEEIADNYFVSEELAGIDRISYSGRAEPVSYQEMLEIEGIPNRFRMMEIFFYADETEVGTVECPYGGNVPVSLYPDIPTKQGFYADWDIKDLSNVLYDEDVTAEYVRYLTTLASTQTRQNAQSVILADGMFKREDALNVTGGAVLDSYTSESINPNDGMSGDGAIVSEAAGASYGSCIECWSIMIPEDGSRMHQLRYQAPEGRTEGIIIYVKQGDEWMQADTELMGIYHLFTVEGTKAEIVVCLRKKNVADYLIYIILAITVILSVVIFYAIKTGKKRMAGKKKRP